MPDQALPSLAITAASNAFSHWSRLTIDRRQEIVRRFAKEVAANAASLVALLMDEVGKLRDDAESEVAAVVAKAEISIEMLQARRSNQDMETSAGLAQVRYRPLGVVLVLGPFNFPAHLPGGHIIPALLSGNTIVFKPSELAPRVGHWLVEAWQHAGLPEGVLNLIQGDAEIAHAAIADPRIAAVFFTGGYRAGAAIHRQLAGRPEVLLALEMGGINPIVLTPPYEIAHATSLIVQSAFISAGQRCTCARRLVVVEDEQGSRAIEAIVKAASEIRCGLAADLPAAEMGPVVSAVAAQQLLQTQREWLRSGGIGLLAMVTSKRSERLVTPGIVDMTQADWTKDEEWFGPLLQIYRVGEFGEAMRIAGATRYGLAASLIGGDASQFDAFRNTIAAGVINWNMPTTGASGRLPFGGVGSSGNHRPAGAYAIDFCNDPVASLVCKSEPSQTNER